MMCRPHLLQMDRYSEKSAMSAMVSSKHRQKKVSSFAPCGTDPGTSTALHVLMHTSQLTSSLLWFGFLSYAWFCLFTFLYYHMVRCNCEPLLVIHSFLLLCYLFMRQTVLPHPSIKAKAVIIPKAFSSGIPYSSHPNPKLPQHVLTPYSSHQPQWFHHRTS